MCGPIVVGRVGMGGEVERGALACRCHFLCTAYGWRCNNSAGLAPRALHQTDKPPLQRVPHPEAKRCCRPSGMFHVGSDVREVWGVSV